MTSGRRPELAGPDATLARRAALVGLRMCLGRRTGLLRPGALALVAAAALVAGCGHTESPAVSDCASDVPGAVLVTSDVRNGQASPAPHRVLIPEGSTVRVQVTTDKVVQIHIHGYDLEYDAAPDTPGCVSFVADRAGLFDVEAHPDTLLLQLEVR
ncbi:hypothetical protein ACQPZX_29680 [Actinoplanes sp. CA-142083]|uniref:hypothetical protein n=1 Tax=Actinoplanes sp. CA-142083 TaxID=3239903 RepID=UPI003D8B4823